MAHRGLPESEVREHLAAGFSNQDYEVSTLCGLTKVHCDNAWMYWVGLPHTCISCQDCLDILPIWMLNHD